MMKQYKTITLHELQQWIAEKKTYVLLDVLGKRSFEQCHLPDAKSVDAHQPNFIEQVQSIIPNKEQTIVVYDYSDSSSLSAFAARKLTEAGYTTVYEFPGGIVEWKKAKGDYFVDTPKEQVIAHAENT